jgi:hypothetical protein
MAIFTSDKINSGTNKLLPLGYAQSILGTCAVPATLAINDVLQMAVLTSDASLTTGDGFSTGGPTITNIRLGADDLDIGTTLLMHTGDSVSVTRFGSNATIGQTGGVTNLTSAACLGYKPFGAAFTTYTTPSLQTYIIQVAIAASATTPVAGNVRLLVEFTIDP